MKEKTLEIRIPHDLGRQEARRRVEAAVARLRSDQAAKVASIEALWEGDHLQLDARAMGQRLQGQVTVSEKEVQVRVVLPWLLATLAEKLKPMIEHHTKESLRLPPPEA